MSIHEDLNQLLDNAPVVSMDSSARVSVVDWSAQVKKRLGAGYFKIQDVEKDINADFLKQGLRDVKDPTKPKTIYYSQVLGWIRRLDKKGELVVVKKVITAGEHKGIYYNISTKAKAVAKTETKAVVKAPTSVPKAKA